MRFPINCVIFLSFFSVFSQSVPDFEALDSLYREDQFYIGVTYNTIQKKPAGVIQNKFTPSFSIGFLRDMPINKARNKAFAAGLGYSLNSYNQNILISESNGTPVYNTIQEGTLFDTNNKILTYNKTVSIYSKKKLKVIGHIFHPVYYPMP